MGHESANDTAAEVGDLPLLQDDADNDVWASWQATYRDVQIVDANGDRAAVYNLTEHDLGDPDNYETLRQMLLDAVD